MHHPAARCWTLLATLALLGAAPTAGAEDEAPKVEIVAATGAVSQGRWQALGEALTIQPSGAGAASSLPQEGLREVRFAAADSGTPGDRVRATLVGGEVLLAESIAPAPDGVTLTARSFGTLRVPFDVLQTLETLPAKAGVCLEPAGRLPARPGSDRVALASGDELSGTLLAAEEAGLRVEIERGRERVVTWSELLAARLDNPCPGPSDVLRLEVETHAGDLLYATQRVTGDARMLSVPLASDASMLAQVPLAAVRTLRWRGGANPCVDATTLAFSATTTPLLPAPEGSLAAEFLARERGVRVGRRPRGCPLRLDGTTYAHGFAVHSGSTITLPLAGRFARFDALVGIDDEAEEEGRGRVPVPGHVDVRVLGDGKVLWEAKGVAGLEAARKVGPIDVRGVTTLVLAVDYGGYDDVLDRATWADPVLTR